MVNIKSRCISLLRFWCKMANDDVNDTGAMVDFFSSLYSL